MKRLTFLILSLFLILCEAISEGFALKGAGEVAGIMEFVYRAMITICLFAWMTGEIKFDREAVKPRLLWLLAGYVLLRFALFDYVFNLSAGLDLSYIGNTKIYDQIWQWAFTIIPFAPAHVLGMLRLIAFAIGLTWLLRK